MPISSLSPAPARDGVPVASTVSSSDLITAIADASYFDVAGKIKRVDVYYESADVRQRKIVSHFPFSGSVTWTANADSGTWQKNLIKVWDQDEYCVIISRATIGSGEDVTLA